MPHLSLPDYRLCLHHLLPLSAEMKTKRDDMYCKLAVQSCHHKIQYTSYNFHTENEKLQCFNLL